MSTETELAIPDQVRKIVPRVAKVAHQLWQTADQTERPVILRLITDSRMRRVWHTLTEASRDAKKPAGWPASLEERQKRAEELFRAACQTRVGAFRQETIEEFQKDAREVADGLADKADLLGLIRRALYPAPSIGVTKDELAALRSIIEKCRMAADDAEKLPLVERDTGGLRKKRQQRGYLQFLVHVMREQFGSELYRTTAMIASVALQEIITVKMVRNAAGKK